MGDIKHSLIEVNDTKLHIAEQGEGPLVIMCHGAPGIWYTWRHQLKALAEAGYHAVAVDTRGYGQSARPLAVEDYAMDILLKDMMGLQDALGGEKAIWIGHDFGANLVWTMAAHHPERVAGVVSLCVPYFNIEQGKPSEMFAMMAEQHFVHFHYYQQREVPERDLYKHPKEFLKRLYWALSGKGNLFNWENFPAEGTSYFDVLEPAPDFPWAWMTEEDLDYIVGEYVNGQDQASAFIGLINSYRVGDIDWEKGNNNVDKRIEVPTLFVTGENDPATAMLGGEMMVDVMKMNITDFRDAVIIPEVGHHVQQEAVEEVNTALLNFMGSLNLK